MKYSFKMEEVTCIQQLLNTVSHGNAIIAEVLRLKDNIPIIFKLENKEDQLKYGEIIFDFSYFKNSNSIEKKISNNVNLQELDDEFKESNLPILARFYLAFENIYQYITDLNVFLEQLTEGSFIQQTIDTILQDNEGKQLLCESVYLYGCMLLVCEAYIPGHLRERLLVAYHRTAVSHHQTNLDSVCKLLGDTGFRNIQGTKRPAYYPDEFFMRIPIDEMFINIIIGRLRSEDVYNQITIYPLPDHRSTALATQAAMLVVCLFFAPNILMFEAAKMREVVDKYFPDNWVVSLYMGITVNLIEVWDTYKAAKTALTNTINSKNIKDTSLKHVSQMNKLCSQTEKLLQNMGTKEDKLMDNINKILSLIRECNVTLRWLTIHTTPCVFIDNNKRCKQVRDQIIAESKFQPMDLFNLLINSSMLELRVKELLRESLDNKEKKWNEQQKEASERIIDLCEVFSGNKPLARVNKNENLCNWFKAIARQIDSLNREDMSLSTKKIIQLIQALEDVQEFHQLDDIMQVKQWLIEARSNLKDMVRGGGFTEDSLVALQVCTDLSYGWYAARAFIDLGREALHRDPNVVSYMRAIFLKLASALEIPLLRINQAGSPDLLSVSQYYSNELVLYVKEVLQIIPETVFRLLERIIELQTSVIKELPTRLDKDKLKEYAQLDHRMEVARLTHSVSIFTSGILKMRSTLVGVICIDPKQLLEDGIRREVSKLVGARLQGSLCNGIDGTLSTRLTQLAHHMDGYRRSFEYIQDYINIHGLKIWQEEVYKIINRSIEEECVKALRLKSSQPTVMIFGKDSNNIFACLLQDIYALVDPKNTVYVEHNSAWYDYRTRKETANMGLFSLIHRGVGAAGLRALSKLIGSCITVRLSHLYSLLESSPPCNLSVPPPRLSVSNPTKFYSQASVKFLKVWPIILEWVMEIGTGQLITKHLNYQLNTSCKFDSTHLEASLRAVNEALINNIKSKRHNQTYTELLPELVEMMHCAGINDPYRTVYVKTNNNHVSEILFLFAINQLPKMEYIHISGTLMARRSTNHIDGAPFAIGIITLLCQHHEYCLVEFVLLFCQYIISHIDAGLNLKNPELTTEAYTAMKFMENFCRISKVPESFIESVIPSNILTQYQFMCSKTV